VAAALPHIPSCSSGQLLEPFHRHLEGQATLGCLPALLGTQNVLCSKQIILGVGKGRRGIAGQRKRLT